MNNKACKDYIRWRKNQNKRLYEIAISYLNYFIE